VIVNNERTTVSAAKEVEIENISEKQKVAVLELAVRIIVKRPHGGGSGGSWI
jgi:hypothetical protein